jgi:hypothetical protein
MARRFGIMLVLAAAATSLPAAGETIRPSTTDVEAHDATELFSHLCVTTRGDRARAMQIIGDGDSAIEKLDDKALLELQGGKPGGVGWTIRMPLGEKLLVEFTPRGTCIVRAPRVNPASLEMALLNLLDEISASGQFKVRRLDDDTKTINKMKYHFVTYGVRLPDTGETAEIGVATTDAKSGVIQGTLTYEVAGKS